MHRYHARRGFPVVPDPNPTPPNLYPSALHDTAAILKPLLTIDLLCVKFFVIFSNVTIFVILFMTKMHANDASEIIFIFHMNMYFLPSYLNSCLVCSMIRDLKNIKVKLKYINLFFLLLVAT